MIPLITKEQAAIHEAAHTLVAVLVGLPIGDTSITETTPGCFVGEANSFHRYGGAVAVEKVADQIASILAGTVAERIAGFADPIAATPRAILTEIQCAGSDVHTHWQWDIYLALTIASTSVPGAVSNLLVAGWIQADKLLREHRLVLEAIADALLETNSLTANEVESIVASHVAPRECPHA